MNFIIRSLPSLLLFSLPIFSQESIQRPDVERLLRTLSADSMEGRGSLTPGNERAGRFIESEFASIGLQPIAGERDFRQSVLVTEKRPGLREASVNGSPVPADEMFVMSEASSVTAERPGDFAVAYVGKDAKLRQKLMLVVAQKRNTLVLVCREQQPAFERFKRFYAGRSIHVETDDTTSIVAVLMDSIPVTSYRVHFENSVEVKPLYNIAGMIPGKRSNEIVLFSAHYDHLGIITPVDGDSIANGADDDASGTAAVVTLARYFAGRGTPERTLMFVAFAAEEIGGFGSQYFSKQLKPESIVAMCNIEMIGMPSKYGPNSAWITGFNRSDLGKIVQEASKESGFSLYPDPYPEQNLFFRSDNATLARLGVPAHSFSSSQIDTDPYYHTVNDEIGTLDLESMTSVIRGLASGMAPIISGEKTPMRITDVSR